MYTHLERKIFVVEGQDNLNFINNQKVSIANRIIPGSEIKGICGKLQDLSKNGWMQNRCPLFSGSKNQTNN